MQLELEAAENSRGRNDELRPREAKKHAASALFYHGPGPPIMRTYFMPTHMRDPLPNGTKKRSSATFSAGDPSSQRVGAKAVGFRKMEGSIRTLLGVMLTGV